MLFSQMSRSDVVKRMWEIIRERKLEVMQCISCSSFTAFISLENLLFLLQEKNGKKGTRKDFVHSFFSI